MTCNHKWVTYQPLLGDSYVCCANSGCGIKYSDYLKAKATEEAEKEVQLPIGEQPPLSGFVEFEEWLKHSVKDDNQKPPKIIPPYGIPGSKL